MWVKFEHNRRVKKNFLMTMLNLYNSLHACWSIVFPSGMNNHKKRLHDCLPLSHLHLLSSSDCFQIAMEASICFPPCHFECVIWLDMAFFLLCLWIEHVTAYGRAGSQPSEKGRISWCGKWGCDNRKELWQDSHVSPELRSTTVWVAQLGHYEISGLDWIWILDENV